jgi:hypothetical protein
MRLIALFAFKLIKRWNKPARPKPGTDRFERALDRAASKFFA